MIPVVDIGCFVRAAEKSEAEDKGVGGVWDTAEGKDTAQALHDAFCQHGFCYLVNHGVPQSVVSNMFTMSKTFFQLPHSVKEKYARGDNTDHGWGALGRERLNHAKPADLKETFDFSPCEEVTSWPEELPNMFPVFDEFFQTCRLLSGHVLDMLGVALRLEDRHYLRKCHSLCGQKGNYTTARSLYYPPVLNLQEGQIHCGEHTDYRSFTLLFQDDTGGLQVLGKDDQYHDVQPVPGAIVVNIGDLMQRWTADTFLAAKHRVIVPRKAAEEGRARQSVVFFFQPDDDTLITCLDGSDTYPPITSQDYLWGRLNESY